MRTNRPKLKIPFETIDIVIELASIAALIIMWGCLILSFGELPNELPSHFDGAGKPDNYGGKSMLWFLVILATVLYIGLFILNRYPHLHNYMVNITEENAYKQYQLSTRFLRIINFLCAVMFAYIVYKTIAVAEGSAQGLGNGFLFTVLGLSFIVPIIMLIIQQRTQ